MRLCVFNLVVMSYSNIIFIGLLDITSDSQQIHNRLKSSRAHCIMRLSARENNSESLSTQRVDTFNKFYNIASLKLSSCVVKQLTV